MGSWAKIRSQEHALRRPSCFRIPLLAATLVEEKPTREMLRECIILEIDPCTSKWLPRRQAKGRLGFRLSKLFSQTRSIKHIHTVAHPVLNGSGDLR